MLLADKLNQVTSLKFSATRRNVALPADQFSFTPPPGVDVIGLDAP
jgi:outer membrane lipoprotein carrier protein